MNTPTKILIIRLSSIGDILHCSAIPRHLKAKFPDAEIHWLVRSDNTELISYNPNVNRVINFHRDEGLKGWLLLSLDLAKEGYTHVYDAHNNLRSVLLCFFLKPRFFVRRSKDRLKRFMLFRLKVNRFPKPFRAVDSYLTPLNVWGIFSDRKGPEIHLSPQTQTLVKNKFPQLENNFIAIAPASAWRKKNWPVQRWLEFVNQILKNTDLNVCILGGPKDVFCKKLAVHPERTLNLQGRLTLLESAAAISFCKTLVSADTGLLHIAEGLGKDVVGLLGPTPFGHPYRPKSFGVQKALWCQPCSKDGSGPCINFSYQKCMKLITTNEVFTYLNRLLDNSS